MVREKRNGLRQREQCTACLVFTEWEKTPAANAMEVRTKDMGLFAEVVECVPVHVPRIPVTTGYGQVIGEVVNTKITPEGMTVDMAVDDAVYATRPNYGAPVTDYYTQAELKKMLRRELERLCYVRGIGYGSKMTKATLVAMLLSHADSQPGSRPT